MWVARTRVCVCVLVTQSCPTLWDPTDCSPPGSSVHGILQTRIWERIAIPFSRGPSQTRDQTWSPALRAVSFSLWVTPWKCTLLHDSYLTISTHLFPEETTTWASGAAEHIRTLCNSSPLHLLKLTSCPEPPGWLSPGGNLYHAHGAPGCVLAWVSGDRACEKCLRSGLCRSLGTRESPCLIPGLQ